MATGFDLTTLAIERSHRGERLKPGLQRWSPGFSRSPRLSLGSKTPILHPAVRLIEPVGLVAADSNFGGSTLTDFDASLSERASELASGCGEGIAAGFDS